MRIASSSTAAFTAASSRLCRSALLSEVVDPTCVAREHLNPGRDRLAMIENPPVDELAKGAGERFTMYGGADESFASCPFPVEPGEWEGE